MIGRLPTQLLVDGQMYDIRTDYRDCLLIFEAFNDPEMSEQEKQIAMIEILYKEVPDNLQEAAKQAVWFLDCGNELDSDGPSEKALYDWNQDEQMIFSAVNKVAGHEVRMDEYMHFWTFISLFHGIGESLFSIVVSIRDKKNHGKKLDKVEQEFYRKNKALIDLRKKLTKEEKEEQDRINAMYS